ncbi:fasciclin-like arabinogalactan protein 10 [Silene latifolia]|uniref:fasciclin-like arabinogalactan protein 10 n=1 Tax=Silene latifolia TaxID=37657 RepID=UPI003D7818BE
MSPPKPLLLLLILTIATTLSSAHNITQILDSDPNLSQFNNYLTRTKLADEINSRQTITVLAIPNSAISPLSNLSLAAVKNTLSLHVVLDYYDAKKLHDIQDGTVITTTLYQTTGQAESSVGELNITDAKGGAVKFGSAKDGAKLDSTYVKQIKQIPFSLSVIEITAPILVPELLTATDDVNVTGVLTKAGCKTFAALLSKSGVLKRYEDQLKSGITVFAPNDEAFKAKGVPDLDKLSSADIVSLLQFHALSSYAPIGTLKTTKGSLQTLAPAGKFGLTASTAGDAVTLHTGVDSSRIATTLVDASPVVFYSVDSVLLPVALFGMSPTPAPAPAPESDAPSPSPEADTPSPSKAPAASPPAPPSDSSPAGEPSADSPEKAADEHSKKNDARGSAALLNGVVLSVAFGVVSLMF